MTKSRVTNATRWSVLEGKAFGLEWLVRNGARVPGTWVIDKREDVGQLPLTDENRYAVRSSAADEDTRESASAGVYLTELNVALPDIPDSVERVLASGGHTDRMAVIVQEMVDPVVSGVAFSRNPVTGLSDIVVEAIEGQGEALLQDGEDPLRWVFRNGEFLEEPGRMELMDLATLVVEETRRLSSRFGPSDLEWVWDGSDLYWVQIRPITTIDNVPLYSRRIAKDVLPGMIKPLVWSVNIPMVNSAWVRLFTQAIGSNDLDPASLARSFAYRAYFDMRAIGEVFERTGMPRDSLENLLGLPGAKARMRPGLGSLVKLPRLVVLALRLWTGASRFERERRELHSLFEGFDNSNLADLSDDELLADIAELIELGERSAYTNIVVPLLANVHARTLRVRLAKTGIALEDYSFPIDPAHNPSDLMARLGQLLVEMDASRRDRAFQGDTDALDASTRGLLDQVVSRFGYLSENTNDMSSPRWREDPALILRIAYTSKGSNNAGPTYIDEVVDGINGRRRRRRVLSAVRRATRAQHMREAAGATYAYGYGLLRPRFLELGTRLMEGDALDEAADVFYLTRAQAEQALTIESADCLAIVTAEKQSIAEVEGLLMPDLIVGDRWVPEPTDIADRLEGVGASRGRHRGRARFVESLDQADTLQDGEVLVVEYSDVAWTTLFTRAGAVVTAAGGLLAHSSITAREMGLPCVASVANARLLDGLDVLVDGSEGVVLVGGGDGVNSPGIA